MTAVRHGAIVGFGNVAANGHVPGWRARSDVRIVAVADPDPLRRVVAEELLPGVRTYAGHDELLRNERLDFVDIAAPPAMHASLIGSAAQRGVHVLCEKPLTTSVEQYEDARVAVDRAGVVLYTVHNWKFSEAFRAVRQVLADGVLGSLQRITFETARNGCAVTTRDNWRVRADLAGGGILVDHGWHAFYLLLALANQAPRRIRAVLERQRYVDAQVEDTAACVIEFASLVGEVRLTWAATERRTRWQLVGDAGELRIDEDQLIVHGRDGRYARTLAASLSAGSHHPEWFAGVIDAFCTALDDPAACGANRVEAETCLLLLTLAYASAGRGSCALDVPRRTNGLVERMVRA